MTGDRVMGAREAINEALEGFRRGAAAVPVDGRMADGCGVEASKLFTVRRWDTDEVLSEHKTLAIARRHAKGEGHNGVLAGERYQPVAYVANEKGECVYNPRFDAGLNIGGLTIGPDDCLRG